MENEVWNIYEITASIRELMRHHKEHGNIPLPTSDLKYYGFKEGKTLEDSISTHIFWLNEALHELKDKLVIVMNPLYKPHPKWRNSVFTISIVFNVLLVITLIISFI
jgi:hypothetical protein